MEPQTPPAQPPSPPLLRFIDSFLDEKNIRWLLAVGSLILLCSSLMLVANHWGGFTPFWQYLIMFAYTGFIGRLGRWCHGTLGLRSTGTGLTVLTVLLLPALFFALGWMPVLSTAGALLYALLLALTGAFALLTVGPLFRYLLGAAQPTFLASYALLSAAYALLPLLPQTPAVTVTALAALWAVLLAGSVKINRQLFWRREEKRPVRVFEFFPLALLAALYLGLFALYGYGRVATEWLGLGCALVALPPLLTADAVARVFARRSGGLISERPLMVMIPVLVGLTLVAAGVLLALGGVLSGGALPALSPTLLLAAAATAAVAYRSEKSVLVWAALAALVGAYHSGLAALPTTLTASASVAYYGLSYLPLLLALTLAAVTARRRGPALLATPLRRLSGVLPLPLLVVALFDAGAAVTVGAAFAALWGLQTVLYRRRWAYSAALFSAVSALVALPLAGLWPGVDDPTWALLAAAVALLAAGASLDRRAPRAAGLFADALPDAVTMSRYLALTLPLWYLLRLALLGPGVVFELTLLALLGVHVWRRPGRVTGLYTLLFGYGAVTALAIDYALSASALTLVLTLCAAGQASAALLYERRSGAGGERYRLLVLPAERAAWLPLAAAVALSLSLYLPLLWLAGAAATATLYLTARLRRQPLTQSLCIGVGNLQLLALAATLFTPADGVVDLFTRAQPQALLLVPLAAVSALAWRRRDDAIAGSCALLLYLLAGALLLTSLPATATPLTLAAAFAGFVLLLGDALVIAYRRQSALWVWIAKACAAAAVGYALVHDLLIVGGGTAPYVLLAVAGAAMLTARGCRAGTGWAFAAAPLTQSALALPALAAALALLNGTDAGLPALLSAAVYGVYGHYRRDRRAVFAALAIANVTLMQLWPTLGFSDPQFYLIPVGVTVLALRRLFADQLAARLHAPLNTVGALLILTSPLFSVVTGSWLHIFSLMLLSVAVIVLAIGLRVRALLYLGSAFLAADLTAMVIRGGVDHPSLLWLAGLALGGAVIALAAFAERHRERLLQRLRMLSATLQTWQ